MKTAKMSKGAFYEGLRLFMAMVWLVLCVTISVPEAKAATSAYDAVFKVGGSSITSIVNNGGHYGTSTIDKAIDGNSATHWETGTPNSSTFKNVVTVTFDQIYTLSRVEYLVRQGADWKGFPLHYKLYSSATASGEDFTLLKEDTYVAAIRSIVPFEFPDTNIRRIRFEFVQAKENWASIAEISFYKPDPFLKEFHNAFTDKSYSQLTPAYNNSSAIQDLMDMAATHPDKDLYTPILDDAQVLLSNPTAFDHKIFTAEQRGSNSVEGNRGQMDARHSMLSTGYYVTPGEKIIVYLDAGHNGIMPNLAFGQALTVGGGIGSWLKTYGLTPGINVIQSPGLAVDETDGSLIRPAPIYLENQAYPNQQAYAPKIRIVGGTKFPMYVHGTTNANDFLTELATYVSNVENNDLYFDYITIANSNQSPKFYNIMELVTANTTTTTSARAALAGLNEQFNAKGLTIADSAETWERFFRVMNEYSGFVETDPNPIHHAPKSRLMSRLFNEGPHAWAGYGITGYQSYGDINNGPRDGGFAKELVMVDGPGGGWGEAHEWGHIYDNWNIEIAEITNNMYSLRMQREFGIPTRLTKENRWNTIKQFNEGKPTNLSAFEETGISYQLEIKFGLNDLYPKVNRYLREESPKGTFSGLDKWQVMAVAMSKAANVDVTPHYAHYNKSMNNTKVQQLVSGLPVLQQKTWLLTDQAIPLGTFVNQAKPQVTSVSRFDTGVQLTFGINEPQNTVLAYEIYRNGALIGISYGSTYLDITADVGQVYEYEIIAYDGKAFASPKSDKYQIRGKKASIFSPTWTYTASPAAQSAYPLSNAFDKNTGTFFESLKQSGNKSVTIDMQSDYYVEGFSYVARPNDQWNVGMMKNYHFYVSLDGVTWNKVIDNGTVPNPAARGTDYNNISLPFKTKARYVKLESLSVLHGDNALAIAEFSITGSADLFDPNATYKIVSKSSGKAIGVPAGNTNNGAQVYQYTYDGNDHMQWKFTPNSDGSYKMINTLSNKVADVQAGSTADGANIIQYQDSGQNNQHWDIVLNAQGHHTITSKRSGKLADVNENSLADGAKIIQYSATGGDNQLWSIVEVE